MKRKHFEDHHKLHFWKITLLLGHEILAKLFYDIIYRYFFIFLSTVRSRDFSGNENELIKRIYRILISTKVQLGE